MQYEKHDIRVVMTLTNFWWNMSRDTELIPGDLFELEISLTVVIRIVVVRNVMIRVSYRDQHQQRAYVQKWLPPLYMVRLCRAKPRPTAELDHL